MRQPTSFELLLKGVRVHKRSGKPFKSGKKVNTVRGIVINSNTLLDAFIFEEDDSVVDVKQCRITFNEESL